MNAVIAALFATALAADPAVRVDQVVVSNPEATNVQVDVTCDYPVYRTVVDVTTNVFREALPDGTYMWKTNVWRVPRTVVSGHTPRYPIASYSAAPGHSVLTNAGSQVDIVEGMRVFADAGPAKVTLAYAVATSGGGGVIEETDPTVVVAEVPGTPGLTNVMVKGVGVVPGTVELRNIYGVMYRMTAGFEASENGGTPEFVVRATDQDGYSWEFALNAAQGFAYNGPPLCLPSLDVGWFVAGTPHGYDGSSGQNYPLLSKWTFDGGRTIEYDSQAIPGSGGGCISIDRIGDDTHTLYPDGTVELRAPANTLLRAAPWTVVRNGVTQDVATVGSPFYADGFWDVTEVSDECADVPPLKGGMYQSSLGWSVWTNRWYASRPPIPMRVVSTGKLAMETCESLIRMIDDATNDVATVSGGSGGVRTLSAEPSPKERLAEKLSSLVIDKILGRVRFDAKDDGVHLVVLPETAGE